MVPPTCPSKQISGGQCEDGHRVIQHVHAIIQVRQIQCRKNQIQVSNVGKNMVEHRNSPAWSCFTFNQTSLYVLTFTPHCTMSPASWCSISSLSWSPEVVVLATRNTTFIPRLCCTSPILRLQPSRSSRFFGPLETMTSIQSLASQGAGDWRKLTFLCIVYW